MNKKDFTANRGIFFKNLGDYLLVSNFHKNKGDYFFSIVYKSPDGYMVGGIQISVDIFNNSKENEFIELFNSQPKNNESK